MFFHEIVYTHNLKFIANPFVVQQHMSKCSCAAAKAHISVYMISVSIGSTYKCIHMISISIGSTYDNVSLQLLVITQPWHFDRIAVQIYCSHITHYVRGVHNTVVVISSRSLVRTLVNMRGHAGRCKPDRARLIRSEVWGSEFIHRRSVWWTDNTCAVTPDDDDDDGYFQYYYNTRARVIYCTARKRFRTITCERTTETVWKVNFRHHFGAVTSVKNQHNNIIALSLSLSLSVRLEYNKSMCYAC
jgi:hypothetical protein